MKSWLIGSNSAEEANDWPRWERRNDTTPSTNCNLGT